MRIVRCLGLALAVSASALGGLSAGCGPAPPSNLSPTSDQDAERYARATQYTRELARRNQDAERKAMRRKPLAVDGGRKGGGALPRPTN